MIIHAQLHLLGGHSLMFGRVRIVAVLLVWNSFGEDLPLFP